jgi:hypothetical protein
LALATLALGVHEAASWWVPGVAPASIDRMGPQELVVTYLHALADGERATARACIDLSAPHPAPVHVAGIFDPAEADGLNHFSGMRALRLTAPEPWRGYPAEFVGYSEVEELGADWAADNGPMTVFVIVGRRSTPRSQWRVLSVGSGP